MRWNPFQNDRGTATVEFALVVPVLVTLLIGMLAVVQAMGVAGKVGAAASSMADILTQAKTLSDSDLKNIVVAGQQVLYPEPTDAAILGGRITLVNFTPSGNSFKGAVGWDYAFGSAPGNAPDLAGLASLAQTGVSVVVVSLTYKFRPLLVNPIFDHIDFTRTSVARPRLSNTITRS